MAVKANWVIGEQVGASAMNAVGAQVNTNTANTAHFNVKNYGAAGDGVADDTSEIQAAITAAVAADVAVFFPAGTYKVSSTVTLPAKSKLFLHDSAVIDGSTVATQTPIFKAEGTTGATTTLATNATEHSLACTVASATGFAAGDYVRLESSASTGSDGVLAGEVLRILSIATNTITFESRTQDTYATAATAKITKLNMVDGVEITGGTIQGQQNYATALSSGVWLHYCINARIHNVRFRQCHQYGVDNWVSLFTRITNCDFYFCEHDAFGYAVAHDGATQDAVVTGCSFTRCKTAVDHTGSTTVGGVARRCIFANNTIVGSYRAGMQSHNGAEDLVFANNTVDTTMNDPTFTGGQCDGMAVHGTRMVIVGNVFRGLYRNSIYTSNSSAKPLEVLIANNHFRGSALESSSGNGMLIDVSFASFGAVESVIVTGNDLTMNTTQNSWGALRITGPSTGTTAGGYVITNNKFTGPAQWHAIEVYNIKDFTIADNRLVVLATSAAAAGVYVEKSIDGVISGNVIAGSGSGTTGAGVLALDSTDVAVTGNRIKGFFNGVKTTGTSNFWAVAGNALRGFVSGGATTSLVGANNATTGANV